MFLRSSRAGFVRKVALAVAPATILLAGYAGPATASTSQFSLIQDDRVFASENPAAQTEGFDAADSVGAGTIHTLLLWAQIAPGRESTTKPSFDATNPNAYPSGAWDKYDNLVLNAKQRGMKILMTPTGPTPRWAGGCAPVDSTSPYNCRPKAADYKAFVQAAATRYSGKFKNAAGRTLPKVDMWSLWNEPNEKGWIQPNSTGVNAGIYRALVYSGLAGLKKAKARQPVLLGETAPLHNALLFWQNLFCMDAKGKALKGSKAKKADCKSGKYAKKFAVAGVAHHPYDRGGTAPFKKPKKNDINLTGVPKLESLLDKAGSKKLIKRKVPIYFTEFGVTTKPAKFGVSYSSQAEAINRVEFIGYDDKRIKSYAQYELDDDRAIPNTFQTGLRDVLENAPFGGTPKQPTWDAYRMPLYVTGSVNKARVWGGVRIGAKKKVAIQTGKGSSFKTIKTVKVNKYGYINVKNVKVGKRKSVRLEFKSGSETFHSRVAKVAKR
jgi:hypothetical protein